MTLATLDANVLVSGFASHGPATVPARLIDAWRADAFTLITSEYIIGEVARTFEKPYFRRHMTSDQIAGALRLLREEATVTPILVAVRGVATHPEDDLVLATALSGGAQFLVTGDHRLCDLRFYQGVTVLSPRAFLELPY